MRFGRWELRWPLKRWPDIPHYVYKAERCKPGQVVYFDGSALPQIYPDAEGLLGARGGEQQPGKCRSETRPARRGVVPPRDNQVSRSRVGNPALAVPDNEWRKRRGGGRRWYGRRCWG